MATEETTKRKTNDAGPALLRAFCVAAGIPDVKARGLRAALARHLEVDISHLRRALGQGRDVSLDWLLGLMTTWNTKGEDLVIGEETFSKSPITFQADEDGTGSFVVHGAPVTHDTDVGPIVAWHKQIGVLNG